MQDDVPWPNAPTHQLEDRGSYCLTLSTLHRQHIFNTPERLSVLVRGLLKCAHKHGWQLEAWAVFPNHYHFVGYSAEPESLTPMIRELHSRLAIWVNRRDGTPGRKVWHNFWDSQLTRQSSYLTRLAYVHQNAVHHQLVQKPADYPRCSAGWLEKVSAPARVRKLYGLKVDRVTVCDEFDLRGSGLEGLVFDGRAHGAPQPPVRRDAPL